MAWLGPVEGREARRTVLFSRHGPGSKAMAACGMLGLGAVRFLSDGSFLVVPGVEPGVFWYTASGELRRAWENREVGLEDECGPVIGRSAELAADPVARSRWVNRRVVVDEILALAEGPALVLRHQDDGTTRWSLVHLGADGRVERRDLAIVGASGWSHLKGDVRGHRVAFLVVEHGRDEPAAAPRLVFAEIVQ
jgi:hypothetical protein